MSNSIRFEFYNNFDIWYDLYQENDGDPNYVINMMMYANKNGYIYGYRYGDVCGYGDVYINGNGYLYEDGNGYANGHVNNNGYGYGYGYGYIYGYENTFGSLYGKGNGSY